MNIAQLGLLRIQLNRSGRRLVGRQLAHLAAGRAITIATFRIATAVRQLIEVLFDELFGNGPFGFVVAVGVLDVRRRDRWGGLGSVDGGGIG